MFIARNDSLLFIVIDRWTDSMGVNNLWWEEICVLQFKMGSKIVENLMIWRRFEIVSAINLDIQLISNTWLYKQIKIMQLNPYMRVPFLFHYCKSHIFMKMKKFNDNFCISNRNNLHRRCQDVVQHSNEKKRKKEKWNVCQI